MNIKKLTITPVGYIKYKNIVHNPKPDFAGELIKNRLYRGNASDTTIARAVRRLPKILRGWVNPETLVIKNRKFV